jgi:scyllo-inositol 2-dehydrogenase (NADP+)
VLAEKTGLVFVIHQNRRWDQDYLSLKELADTQTVGRISYIESGVRTRAV